MIERRFVLQKIKEQQIEEFITEALGIGSHSKIEIKRTPLGEKVTIFSSRPGLVVGRKGENIRYLTETLKNKFNMENPQIEVAEVENPNLEAQAVSERVAYTLERYGSKTFKSVGYKVLQDILNAGAFGAEIVISGKVPGARAKNWRFSAGHLKKSGDISENYVKRGYSNAQLKSGTIGIKVSILHPDTKLPDDIKLIEEQETIEEIKEKVIEEEKTPKETKKEIIEEEKVKKPEIKKEETKEKIKAKKEIKTELKAIISVKLDKDELNELKEKDRLKARVGKKSKKETKKNGNNKKK